VAKRRFDLPESHTCKKGKDLVVLLTISKTEQFEAIKTTMDNQKGGPTAVFNVEDLLSP
jgi:hypothetical protein